MNEEQFFKSLYRHISEEEQQRLNTDKKILDDFQN